MKNFVDYRKSKSLFNNSSYAFTLTEVIFALLVFSLMMIALYTTYDIFYKTSKQQISYTQASEKLRPAIEQLERLISDAGLGIDKEAIYGPTEVDDNDNDTLINGAAISVFYNTGHELLGNITTNPQTDSLPEISVKSLIGENSYSGNFIVYDSEKFENNDEMLSALNMPGNTQFSSIVMNLNKNILSGPLSGLPNDMEDGNIIFVCKTGAQNIDDYYYIKTINLKSTSNSEDSAYSYCAPNTYNLQITRGGSGGEPLIPCVAYFNADFACDTGENFEWKKEICNKVEDIRIVRIGLIVQTGTRNRDMVYTGNTPVLRFPSLGAPYNKPFEYELITDNNDIRNDQRYYRWEIIERQIATSNLD